MEHKLREFVRELGEQPRLRTTHRLLSTLEIGRDGRDGRDLVAQLALGLPRQAMAKIERVLFELTVWGRSRTRTGRR